MVRGQDLHIETLSLGGGDLKVEGTIDSLTYEAAAPKGGFLSGCCAEMAVSVAAQAGPPGRTGAGAGRRSALRPVPVVRVGCAWPFWGLLWTCCSGCAAPWPSFSGPPGSGAWSDLHCDPLSGRRVVLLLPWSPPACCPCTTGWPPCWPGPSAAPPPLAKLRRTRKKISLIFKTTSIIGKNGLQ